MQKLAEGGIKAVGGGEQLNDGGRGGKKAGVGADWGGKVVVYGSSGRKNVGIVAGWGGKVDVYTCTLNTAAGWGGFMVDLEGMLQL